MPSVNSLTRNVGLRVGPIVLETLVKHYLEKIKRDFVQTHGSKEKDKDETVQLRQDELIYDEIFVVVKAFMEAASFHSVEDIQAFSNTRTPSPPWVHVVRVRVPMTSCDEAAKYLITALGGQDVAQKLVGGVRWWQVRSIDGVDAQWITAKKDWHEAKRRYKNKQRDGKDEPMIDHTEGTTYNEDMDTMRCILYAHGGGYYFGSVDQERYSIQRYARKINGRVFAINYRLAPQYPFPCAIQDLIAAYLYLIRPPPGASHLPVKPSHIVVAGDSAGGGLTLALLQVLRDASLPLPAGGILISPWCDMTHSFPSIHTNTATDVIPPYGLSLHKPSTLWPPPDEELAGRVRTGLRERVRAVFKGEGDPNASVVSLGVGILDSHLGDSSGSGMGASSSGVNGMTVDVGATTPLPLPSSSVNELDSNAAPESINLQAQNGEILSIQQQIQLYTTNALLGHPLVSPALGYLGGLPPLMVVVSDREVLRDEGIYMAHKAAHPDQFPVRDSTRALYPALYGIEERFKGKSTPVHLQVYDDTAHVLPVLFSFTTPAKYCFRAMAIFCKYVTGIPLFPTDGGNTQGNSQNPVHTSTRDSFTASVFFTSLSSSMASLAGASAGETNTDTGRSVVSPRSSRTIGSIGSKFSARTKGRKSTPSSSSNSESNSSLKRSASEYHKPRFPSSMPLSPHRKEKKPERSVSMSSLRLRKGMSDVGWGKREREGGDAEQPEGTKHEAGENMERSNMERLKQTTPKSQRRHEIPPVPPLNLSPPQADDTLSTPNWTALAPFSIPLPPSPQSPRSPNYDQATASLTNVITNTSANASMNLIADSSSSSSSSSGSPAPSAIIDVPCLTASPSASLMPSPSLPPLEDPVETEGLPSPPTTPRFLSGLEPTSSSLKTDQVGLSRNINNEEEWEQELPEGGRSGERYAGDPIVYSETSDFPSLHTSLMIRERVSTRGVIRPLEPSSSLSALSIPPSLIGEISERALRRYIEGRNLFDVKFAGTMKEIEKRRKKHLTKARKDTIKNMNALKGSVEREKEKVKTEEGESDENALTTKARGIFDKGKEKQGDDSSNQFSIANALLASSGWSWSWALDHNERPPPSSLVARRDTHEALMLARVADQAVLQDEQVRGLGGTLSGNGLWSLVVGFLTPAGSSMGSGITRNGENAENGVQTSLPQSHSKFGLREKASVSRFRARLASIGKSGHVSSPTP